MTSFEFEFPSSVTSERHARSCTAMVSDFSARSRPAHSKIAHRYHLIGMGRPGRLSAPPFGNNPSMRARARATATRRRRGRWAQLGIVEAAELEGADDSESGSDYEPESGED